MSDQAVVDAVAQVNETPAEQAPTSPRVAAAEAVVKPEPGDKETAEIRRAVLQERLHKLREGRAEKKSASVYEAERQKLEADRKAFEADRQKWQMVSKDPIKALKDLGIAPDQLYQQLTDNLLEEGTPEAKQRQMLKQLQDQIEEAKANPKFSEMEKEIQELREWRKGREDQEKQWQEAAKERQAAQLKQNREHQMLSTLQQPEFAAMLKTYDPGYLIASAYQVAQELQKAGKPADFVSTAKRMKELDDNFWYTKGQERLTSLNPASASESAQKQDKREVATEPANIGNRVASAVASGNERKLSKEERRKEAAKLLDGLTLTSGPVER